MRKRILSNYIITILISALITGALASYFIKNIYLTEKKDKLQSNITLIKNNLEEKYSEEESINFYRLTQEYSSKINTRVTFIDLQGHPMADSLNNSIILQNSNINQEYIDAISGDFDIIKNYSIEAGNVFFYLYSSPIEVGNVNAVIRLGETYDEIDNIIDRFLMYLFLSALVGIFFAIIIAYINVDKIVEPIKELTKASKSIAEGDLSTNITINATDEIQELALNFEIMRSNINNNILKIREKNMEMNAILSSLKDGIVALNLDENIVMINKNVNEILCINKIVSLGQNIIEILGDLEIRDEIIYNISNFSTYYVENKICNDSKLISFTTYPIKDEDNAAIITGTLIIIRDITEIRNLENMRKDFVTNVSHELRTPLTSIAGFVETLKTKDLDDINKIKALDIIGIETERLKILINELLDLSKIENMKSHDFNIEFDVKECILSVVNLLNPQIKNKNIQIKLDLDEKLNSIKGDENLFAQMLINLIENSIKYNNDNGKVTISMSNIGNGLKIIVEDYGIGMVDYDKERIFSRFYRADKSRSSNIEGSGLGLSIVKHIVISFKGTINVESELDKGSKFIIMLPN